MKREFYMLWKLIIEILICIIRVCDVYMCVCVCVCVCDVLVRMCVCVCVSEVHLKAIFSSPIHDLGGRPVYL